MAATISKPFNRGLVALVAFCITSGSRGAITLDPEFNSGPGTGPDVGLFAEHPVALPDGKVLISGLFTTYNGSPARYIARLNEDGTLDPTFKGNVDWWVRHMLVQPDGKILIGGGFGGVDGVPRKLIARLNADGTLDPTFDPGKGFEEKLVPPDPNPPFVFWLALQPDGKVLVTGSFAKFNGEPVAGIIRLNADGSRDRTFNIGTGLDSWGRSVGVDPNGEIMLTGWFVNYNGFGCNRMVLIHPDGTPDPSFHPFFGDATSIYSQLLLPDGKRIVSGHTKNAQGLFSRKIARLNSDGTEDSSFVANTDNRTELVLRQPDGKIWASGWFDTVNNGTPKTRLARFNADGTLDNSIGITCDQFIWTVAFDTKGRLLISGGFENINGIARQGIARLLVDDSVGQIGPPTDAAPVLSVGLTTSGSVSLSWTDDAIAPPGYTIERKDGSIYTTVDTQPGTARSSVVSGLTSSTTYTFRLRADGPTVLYSTDVIVTTTAAPVANPIVVSTVEGQAVPIVLNGTVFSGTSSYRVVTPPGHGQLSGTAPSLLYAPDAGVVGSDSFTYAVSDGSTESLPATGTIQILGVDHPPVAQTLSASGLAGNPIMLTLGGTDPDGDTLSYQIITLPSKGTLTGTGPAFTYTPSIGAVGVDTFTYVVSDGTAQSPPALVSLQIEPLNHPPVASSLNYTSTAGVPLPLILSGTDPDGDALTYRIITSPVQGQIIGNPPQITYLSSGQATGSDSFTYTVSDGVLESGTATVTIQLTHSNHAPVAINQSFGTTAGFAVAVTLGGTDPDGDTLTYQIVTPPAKGQLSGNGPQLIYTPTDSASGSDSFTYLVNDGSVQSLPATVTIDITRLNHAPEAETLSFNGVAGVPMNITLAGTDADHDPLTFIIVTPPLQGQIAGNGLQFTYTPGAGASGTDTFIYEVSDGVAVSQPATVTIQVAPAVLPPAISPIDNLTIRKNSMAQAVPIVITGTSSLNSSLTATSSATTIVEDGGLSIAGQTLFITPTRNAVGTTTIHVQASNGGLTTALDFQLSVTNSPPLANPDELFAFAGAPLQISTTALTSNDQDADGDAISVIAVDATTSGGGTVSLQNQEITYTPAGSSIAEDSFTYQITDTSGAISIGTVIIHLSNPHIDIQPLASGTLDLRITGVPLGTYQILVSQDGRTWSLRVEGKTDSAGTAEFSDSTTGAKMMFYKISWPN